MRTPSILRTILQRGFARSASESPVFREFAIMLPSSLSSHVSFVHGPLGHMFAYIDIYLHLFASDACECLFTQSSAGLLYSTTYLYGYFAKNPWMLKIPREHQCRSKFVSDSKRRSVSTFSTAQNTIVRFYRRIVTEQQPVFFVLSVNVKPDVEKLRVLKNMGI